MVRQQGDDIRDQVLGMFPRLRERLDQRADTLSGGEQQMLATGRALYQPLGALLDEPTEGLQPSMIEQIRKAVTALRARGVAILLVEQRVEAVLSIADRVVFLENGRITHCHHRRTRGKTRTSDAVCWRLIDSSVIF